jgi:single-strand DNA-binding protein
VSTTEVTIVGNVTDTPELRFTPSGAAVAVFNVAVNRRILDRETNVWKDLDPDFHRVTVWRGLAEHVAETLGRGTRVIVRGDLRMRRWEDKETKKPRTGWDITADAVGAELTWATAEVTKVKSNRGDVAPDDPWATGTTQTPAPAGAGAAPGAWPSGSGPRGPQGGYSDEPPF